MHGGGNGYACEDLFTADDYYKDSWILKFSTKSYRWEYFFQHFDWFPVHEK